MNRVVAGQGGSSSSSSGVTWVCETIQAVRALVVGEDEESSYAMGLWVTCEM